jgi:hypothetical protein
MRESKEEGEMSIDASVPVSILNQTSQCYAWNIDGCRTASKQSRYDRKTPINSTLRFSLPTILAHPFIIGFSMRGQISYRQHEPIHPGLIVVAFLVPALSLGFSASSPFPHDALLLCSNDFGQPNRTDMLMIGGPQCYKAASR